jgi:hypothetical protein
MHDIQNKLRELAALWVNPVAANLERILDICKEIADTVASGPFSERLDPAQLRRISVLSCRAEERMVGCDTGSRCYGTPAKRRVTTAQWEG